MASSPYVRRRSRYPGQHTRPSIRNYAESSSKEDIVQVSVKDMNERFVGHSLHDLPSCKDPSEPPSGLNEGHGLHAPSSEDKGKAKPGLTDEELGRSLFVEDIVMEYTGLYGRTKQAVTLEEYYDSLVPAEWKVFNVSSSHLAAVSTVPGDDATEPEEQAEIVSSVVSFP